MINIQNNIAEISIGNIFMGSAYIGNQLVWQKVQEPYIEFIDADVEYVCCVNWGRYIKETVKTVVTADSDIVIITTTSVPYTAKVAGQSTVVTSTREKTESDVVGTTTVTNNIMVGTKISDVYNILGEKSLILHKLRFIYFTNSFDTTIPIYGLKSYRLIKKADCSIFFTSDNGSDYIRLYVYYQYWGYINGGGGYKTVSASWHPSLNRIYITFFDDSMASNYVDNYMTFRNMTGNVSKWRAGLNEILVSIDDVPLE